MSIIILDEIDNLSRAMWTDMRSSKTWAVKGDETVCLGDPSAHERLAWIAKGYEIRG